MKHTQRFASFLQQPTAPVSLARGRRVTLGDVRASGLFVEYLCGSCLRARLFDPRELPFGDLQLIAALHRRMRCGFCGGQGESSMTRPVSSEVIRS